MDVEPPSITQSQLAEGLNCSIWVSSTTSEGVRLPHHLYWPIITYQCTSTYSVSLPEFVIDKNHSYIQQEILIKYMYFIYLLLCRNTHKLVSLMCITMLLQTEVKRKMLISTAYGRRDCEPKWFTLSTAQHMKQSSSLSLIPVMSDVRNPFLLRGKEVSSHHICSTVERPSCLLHLKTSLKCG